MTSFLFMRLKNEYKVRVNEPGMNAAQVRLMLTALTHSLT